MKEENSILELLKKRKTIYEFSDKKVKETDIMKILEAGRYAPSILNIQPWHFILIKDPLTINNIMKLAIYGHFHTNPKLMLAIVLKSEYYNSSILAGFKNQKLGFCEAFQCCGMAAFSMAIEAESLGIGTCFLTPKEGTEINKILKLKNKDVAPIVIGIGYERIGAYQKKKERKELKEILSFETYLKENKSDG